MGIKLHLYRKIFLQEKLLSGFAFDADGNSATGDANGHDVFGGDRVNDGAAIGDYLISDDDDIVTVTFAAYQNNAKLYSVESSVPVSWNMGQIELSKQNFHNSQILVHKIQVTDPDMN